MKAVSLFLLCALFGVSFAQHQDLQNNCTTNKADIPTSWIDMKKGCVSAVKMQITKELKAAMAYLAMGAHFSKDVINRPGFAKLFFESASEEREHGIKLISYLLMRGDLRQDVSTLFEDHYLPEVTSWDTGLDALKLALELEASVTKSIREVIKICESEEFNHYHIVDYLTGDFLEEQYRGQRELAGRISTLGKMAKDHGVLGEFLYDKELLS